MFNNYLELFNGYIDLYSSSSLFKSLTYDEKLFKTELQIEGELQLVNQAWEKLSKRSDCAPEPCYGAPKDQKPSPFKKLNSTSSSLFIGKMNCSISDQLTSNAQQFEFKSSKLVDEHGREITIGSFNPYVLTDFFYVICLFLVFFRAKKYLSCQLMRSTRLRSLGLRAKDLKILVESLWRLIFYSASSAWLIYTCFIRHDSSFLLISGPTDFSGYSFNVDFFWYTACIIEATFYLHASYALIFEDVWRRDSYLMMVHHLAAIISLFCLYATRTHQIGLVSTVLRDTCDVLLEITKSTKCLYIQHGKPVGWIGFMVKFFLTIFALTFAVNQLYFFPLFCIYHFLNLIKVYKLQTTTMMGIATCGLVFLLLDCLWFLLILRLLYMMIAKPSTLRDIREYDEEDLIAQSGCDEGSNRACNICVVEVKKKLD